MRINQILKNDKKLQIQLGSRLIGDDTPSYIIAEIGSNHNQNYNLALESIDAAANAKVDAVKFQTFRAKDHYSSKTPGFNYLNNKNTYQLIESLELNREWQSSLFEYARKKGVEFLSSPCDSDAINELAKLGMEAFKVASFDLPDIQLIKQMAIKQKAVILSTGMADLSDIAAAVNVIHSVGNNQIILLQCTSLYPAPNDLSNLAAIKSMRASFGCLTGYSDHTIGDHVSIAAVALGACIVEKHFTLNRSLPGPDHPFSIEPDGLKQMVEKIRDVESAIGDGIKNGPRLEEKEMFEKGRRSIHAAVDIKQGEMINEGMIIVKRPGYGISPMMRDKVIGRKAMRNIEADSWISWDMI